MLILLRTAEPTSAFRPRRFWWGWGAVFVVTAALVGLIVMPPFVSAPFRGALYDAFAGLCHQLPDRTFHANGHPLAVCHRCVGIYVALPLGALALLAFRGRGAALGHHARWLIPLSVAVPGADWLLGLLGIWANTPVSRASTGAVFGLIAGLYLARAVATAASPPAVRSSHA